MAATNWFFLAAVATLILGAFLVVAGVLLPDKTGKRNS
jgi:hypothetical protein